MHRAAAEVIEGVDHGDQGGAGIPEPRTPVTVGHGAAHPGPSWSGRPEGGRPEAIGVGLRALLEHIAGDRLFARLAFFELPAAGPAALDHADTVLGGFTSYLEADPASPGSGRPIPKVIGEVIGGGIWAVIQHEIHTGKLSELPARAPQIAEFTTTPFGD